MTSRALLVLVLAGACAPSRDTLSEAERRSVADTLEQMVRRAYDVSGQGGRAPLERMLSLYPDSGRVVSASEGRMLTSRDSLVEGIRYFWESMGRNMQQPQWIWERFVTDVLDEGAAVVGATFRVPHRTPQGMPHEIAGAMTFVFARRGGRWVVVQEHVSERPPPPEHAAGGMPTGAQPPR
jgi:ketosteroid isomerase-like protein